MSKLTEFQLLLQLRVTLVWTTITYSPYSIFVGIVYLQLERVHPSQEERSCNVSRCIGVCIYSIRGVYIFYSRRCIRVGDVSFAKVGVGPTLNP